MTGGRWTSAFLVVSILVLSQAAQAAAPIPALTGSSSWMKSYGKARAESRRTGLPLIVHFHARWCGPCRAMERDFLGTSAMKQYLGTRFIGVKIDSDQEPGLVEAFRVTGLPADVIVASDGKIISPAVQGRRSKGQYFAALDRIEREKRSLLAPAREKALALHRKSFQPAGEESTKETVVTALPKPRTGPLIGLEGYSPVRIREKRQWVKGKPELTSTYKGVAYWFADREGLNKFKAAPHKFAPRILGCDPVELWKTDRAVQGSVQFGAFYEGDLYLFVSASSRTEFKRDPVQFTRIRHAVRADGIRSTRVR